MFDLYRYPGLPLPYGIQRKKRKGSVCSSLSATGLAIGHRASGLKCFGNADKPRLDEVVIASKCLDDAKLAHDDEAGRINK